VSKSLYLFEMMFNDCVVVPHVPEEKTGVRPSDTIGELVIPLMKVAAVTAAFVAVTSNVFDYFYPDPQSADDSKTLMAAAAAAVLVAEKEKKRMEKVEAVRRQSMYVLYVLAAIVVLCVATMLFGLPMIVIFVCCLITYPVIDRYRNADSIVRDAEHQDSNGDLSYIGKLMMYMVELIIRRFA
jgi:energy-converting hydrogenase Eha subunit A